VGKKFIFLEILRFQKVRTKLFLYCGSKRENKFLLYDFFFLLNVSLHLHFCFKITIIYKFEYEILKKRYLKKIINKKKCIKEVLNSLVFKIYFKIKFTKQDF
jgi:hypothetical protein